MVPKFPCDGCGTVESLPQEQVPDAGTLDSCGVFPTPPQYIDDEYELARAQDDFWARAIEGEQ